MDRRSLILLVVTCGLLLVWHPLMKRVYPDKPLPATNLIASTTVVGGTNAAAALTAPITAPAVAPVRPGIADSGLAKPAGAGTEMALENDDARFVVTSQGGGIREVVLKHYEEAIVCSERKAGEPAPRAVMNRVAVVPVMALLGVDRPGAEAEYRLSRSNDVVVAQKDLGEGLRVIKEFQLQSNHVMRVTTRLQNLGTQVRAVPPQEWVFGTAEPLHPDENAMYRGFFEYDGNSNQHQGEAWFANRTLGCIPGTPRSEYLSEKTNTVWASTHNQFFATVVIPTDRAARLFARHVELPITNRPPGRPPLTGFQAALVYAADAIPPQQERVREFELYMGPKEYRALTGLGNNADVVMGFDSYFGGRFSGFFARMLLLAMNGIHGVGISYALAIILITVFVRLLFWPLMRASARTSKRMAALQPQIKELQEKYKDNPQKLNQKMLELWREHKVNPASGCLPILIQFPILLGFYSMLQTAIELRGQPFLWACDLSQSDTVGTLFGFPLNPMPLMMGITMLWQARLQPMSPSMDPAQQKIMKYMPLMFMVFLYNFSAGLTLYWTVSNLLSILQMKLTKAMDDKPAATGSTSPGSKPAGHGVPARKTPRNGGGKA